MISPKRIAELQAYGESVTVWGKPTINMSQHELLAVIGYMVKDKERDRKIFKDRLKRNFLRHVEKEKDLIPRFR